MTGDLDEVPFLSYAVITRKGTSPSITFPKASPWCIKIIVVMEKKILKKKEKCIELLKRALNTDSVYATFF